MLTMQVILKWLSIELTVQWGKQYQKVCKERKGELTNRKNSS